MKIPEKIELMGMTIQTEYSDNLVAGSSNLGEAQYCLNKIILASNENVPRSVIEQTYIHELLHFILYFIAEDEINRNEALVSRLSNMLYQVVKQLCK